MYLKVFKYYTIMYLLKYHQLSINSNCLYILCQYKFLKTGRKDDSSKMTKI